MKENAGVTGSIPEAYMTSWERNVKPLQYFTDICWTEEQANHMVPKSLTWLNNYHHLLRDMKLTREFSHVLAVFHNSVFLPAV